MDAAAAQTFARQNSCFKCHAIDKRKDGPAYREVAAKYREKEDAQASLLHHLTSGRQVKFPDGHEESHKILTAPREDIENLIEWLLSL
ncbi:c-type cytochrome [Aromatoleum petrolei]|nr:c-type cytochrome [Aromatoleum petrolei]QTQ34428.1 Putative cytochrome c [Aromatoleum petrolei]